MSISSSWLLGNDVSPQRQSLLKNENTKYKLMAELGFFFPDPLRRTRAAAHNPRIKDELLLPEVEMGEYPRPASLRLLVSVSFFLCS
ncbi:hypothetical protein C0Q70_04040 [Pomacea canaliculata]|uniref:Uncharacterized protein n=1 Tax=Pomacea canaliculata TaxID=400727 RepID=A0A2T7PUJ0_POMCA|nr:hypothetical protein C0Q70_04040 [Pomacea canaliculata]